MMLGIAIGIWMVIMLMVVLMVSAQICKCLESIRLELHSMRLNVGDLVEHEMQKEIDDLKAQANKDKPT